MADSSRNIVLALLLVGVAIALFYMMDPTFGGLLGKREGFQDAMAPTMAQPMAPQMPAMPAMPTAEPILPPNNPPSVSGMKVENFQDSQQSNVQALLDAQKALKNALSKASGSTSGFQTQKKNNTMKPATGAEMFQNMAPSTEMPAMPTEGFMNYKNAGAGAGMEGFQNPASTPFPEATQPANCYPKNQLAPQELLPTDPNSKWAAVNPQGAGDISGKNFLSAGALIGVNTVGQSLRNANQQLRSEPPCPQVQVSIWNQSTIEPDLQRRPLEGF